MIDGRPDEKSRTEGISLQRLDLPPAKAGSFPRISEAVAANSAVVILRDVDIKARLELPADVQRLLQD